MDTSPGQLGRPSYSSDNAFLTKHDRSSTDTITQATAASIEMKSLGSTSTLTVHDADQYQHHSHHHRLSQIEEGVHEFVQKVEHELYLDKAGHDRRQMAWDRFRGKDRRKIGWFESLKNTASSSILNVFLIFVPFAWTIHFTHSEHEYSSNVIFAFSFLSIVPLVKLFDFGGKQMQFYTGKHIGNLIIVTLNNAVEAMLAIVLLAKCELRILQATIVGVVLLHLLLVPGIGFLTGGARIYEQELHQHYTQLNHTLLAIGVLSLLIPAAFFAALDNGSEAENILTDTASVKQFLQMSYGISIILFTVYIASRIFLHNPPGERDTSLPTPGSSKSVQVEDERSRRKKEPRVNPWFCSLFLVVITGITAMTAEMLVTSVEHIREVGHISEEWFGLVLLPMISFSADGFIAVVYFLRAMFFLKPRPPETLAEDRAIDMSIQFTLFWMPILVLTAWIMDRPLVLLFDAYEVAVLIGACFLVNYVTEDSRTNWAEGYIMVAFYIMIVVCTWFYKGQSAISQMLSTCQLWVPLSETVESAPVN